MTEPEVVVGFYFYPRGGSAHACAATCAELARRGVRLRLLAGSRSDVGELARAERFFRGCEVVPVDFTPALRESQPALVDPGPGCAPMHGSYEDRPDAEDPVLATLDDDAFELHVRAWERELERAGARHARLLYLHHLTPINEAAARRFPDVPVIGHVHGSELLMLERIAAGPPSSWSHAEAWAERMRSWAGRCAALVANSERGLERASELLGVPRERFHLIPNGFGPEFRPFELDRAAFWRRQLVEQPRGWAPGKAPGSVRYEPAELAALEGVVLLNVGRYTAVKRLPLLIESYARARERFRDRAALVLVGGYPGEWEGEHPLETIERTGADGVFLAGWHEQAALPEFFAAGDVLVHPSANEQFGQVIVEAMACAVPPIAVERGGPAQIIERDRTGWLIPPDDGEALERALVEAVNDREKRLRLGGEARRAAVQRYAWESIGARLVELIGEVTGASRPA